MKILQLFTSVLGRDPRPLRFYKELVKCANVTVASKLAPMAEFSQGLEFIKLKSERWDDAIKTEQFENRIWTPHYREDLRNLQKQPYSLIVCHEIELLPIAVALKNIPQNKGKCRLIMDAREFYPRQFENDPYWCTRTQPLIDHICKKYLPEADVVFTVSTGIVSGYKQLYDVDCTLLASFAYFHDITPHKTEKHLRFIHHGNALSKRHLEYMVEAFKPLEGKASLDFMLVPLEPQYFEALKHFAKDVPNVNFIPPVPMLNIVSSIAKYDMGVFLLPPNTFNHQHALPNKFFEFIQARLGIIVSPLPEMQSWVKATKTGFATSSFNPVSLTDAILSLEADTVDVFKNNANIAAKELCWEKNNELIHATVLELIQGN